MFQFNIKMICKDILVIIILFLIMFICGNTPPPNNDSGWTIVTPLGENTGDLFDLHFFDKGNGWVTGWTRYDQGWRQIVAFTSDSGNNWDTTMFNTSTGKVISFFNVTRGITGDGIIYNTYDSGKKWTKYDTVFHFFFARLICTGQKYAYCCGTDGKVIKTVDQGETWTFLESEYFKDTRYGGLSVVDSLNVFVSCDDQLLRTKDGGLIWDEINLPVDVGSLSDIQFIDANYGWIVGSGRSIFLTTDTGVTWQNQSPANYWDSFKSIDAIDKNTAVTISKEGAVYWTTNGGVTWIEQVPPGYFGDLFRVQLINENVAWAVGRDGVIIKTTTGGVTWVDEENDGQFPERFVLKQNYPNPFNPATVIEYSIPENGRRKTKNVRLVVYNILGKKVATLVNEEQSPGIYKVTFDASTSLPAGRQGSATASDLASGVYFYQLSAGASTGSATSFTQTKKMVLMR